MFSSFIGVFAVECFCFVYREAGTSSGGGVGFYFFLGFYLCGFILSVLVPTDVMCDNVPLFS